MSVILIEGCDNSGKTMLANKLACKMGYIVVHLSEPDGPDLDQIKPWTLDILKRIENGENIIMDRITLVSERIYGPLLRGDSVFTHLEWVNLWERFIDLRPKIIYCRPPKEVILGSITKRKQKKGVISNCKKLIDEYDFFFYNLFYHDFKKQVFIYDYTKQNEEEKLMGWMKYS